MLLFSKSKSRIAHHYSSNEETQPPPAADEPPTSLTVWTKSLLFNCSGFTVIASDGALAFRVDNYTKRTDQPILMDGSGHPIFTICRRKKVRLLMDNWWVAYEGEMGKYKKKPAFYMRKNISMRQRMVNVIAYVYGGMSDMSDRYTVEGSYTHRSCKILDESKRVVGEIKKKEAMVGGVTFGLEVFHLIVKPGFDSRFAMAIVLLLHQMFT